MATVFNFLDPGRIRDDVPAPRIERDTYFRPLRLIRPHDVIEFTTPEGAPDTP
jgi:hypothetical protein